MASTGRQLFLSKRVVTAAGVADGGVLVDNGQIQDILTRQQANTFIADNEDIKVNDCFN